MKRPLGSVLASVAGDLCEFWIVRGAYDVLSDTTLGGVFLNEGATVATCRCFEDLLRVLGDEVSNTGSDWGQGRRARSMDASLSF